MSTKLDYKYLNQIAAQSQAQQLATQNSQKGLTYFEILSIALVILKGVGYLTCSWFIPFIPIIIPFVLYAFVFIIGVIKGKFFN